MKTLLPVSGTTIAVLALTVVLAGCASGPPVGARAPEFSARDGGGATVSLAAFQDKVVIMDFWATWCPPCRKTSPYVQTLYEQFADNDDVVVVAVHYDDKGDPAAYMAKHDYTFPVILDGSDVVKAYGITRIPTFLVIDRTGTVVHKQAGIYSSADVETLAQIVNDHL